VRAQWTNVMARFKTFFEKSKAAGVISFTAAFIASFRLLDLLFIPLALWSTFKVGAGRN